MWELCVLDDGSTQEYTDIIEKYSKNVNITYKKTENHGIFLARLEAFNMASGEYVAYVDSDDEVTFNYHLPMLLEAERTGADIVMNEWAFATDRSRYFCKSRLPEGKLSGEEILEAFFGDSGKDQSLYVLWNKLYKRELLGEALSDTRLAIDDARGFNYSEDTVINFFVHKRAKLLSRIFSGYYFYRVHTSQSVNILSSERLRSHILGMRKTFRAMERSLPAGSPHQKSLALWRALMSRTHYSHALGGGYSELYPLIKESYGVEVLRRATLSDGKLYAKNRVLGENLSEIDGLLLRLWREGGEAMYNEKDGYVAATVDFVEKMRPSNPNGGQKIVIPRQRVSFKLKLLHNYFVYTLGMILFPKGSKIRAALKKRI
jgi:glycosyltransferase involved in cell wall biosynthesis